MANLLGMNTAKDIYEPVEVEDEDQAEQLIEEYPKRLTARIDYEY